MGIISSSNKDLGGVSNVQTPLLMDYIAYLRVGNDTIAVLRYSKVI